MKEKGRHIKQKYMYTLLRSDHAYREAVLFFLFEIEGISIFPLLIKRFFDQISVADLSNQSFSSLDKDVFRPNLSS